MVDIDWSGYLNYPDLAAKELGGMLHRGELALLLGAGISKGLGLPNWHGLARAMATEARKAGIAGIEGKGINRKRLKGSELGSIFRIIERHDKAAFRAKVKRWLYLRWETKSGNWASDTLVALGSLLSGTNRGRVDTVLTLNFDSVLEMYLRLYGYLPQPISKYPELLARADVHIFHSHGYLPFDREDGVETDVILSSQSYFEALGDHQHPSWRMMDYVFAHKRILAIGTSGDDMPSRAVLANLAKQGAHRGLLGFWVIGPGENNKAAEFRDSKIAAVQIQSYKSDLPEFLFSIARSAAKLMKA